MSSLFFGSSSKSDKEKDLRSRRFSSSAIPAKPNTSSSSSSSSSNTGLFGSTFGSSSSTAYSKPSRSGSDSSSMYLNLPVLILSLVFVIALLFSILSYSSSAVPFGAAQAWNSSRPFILFSIFSGMLATHAFGALSFSHQAKRAATITVLALVSIHMIFQCISIGVFYGLANEQQQQSSVARSAGSNTRVMLQTSTNSTTNATTQPNPTTIENQEGNVLTISTLPLSLSIASGSMSGAVLVLLIILSVFPRLFAKYR